MTTLTYKTVTIRKIHSCHSCYRKFPVGHVMNYWSVVDSGDFGSGYTCKICEEIWNLIPWKDKCYVDGFYEGFVDGGLNKDETPEMYLETLKNK